MVQYAAKVGWESEQKRCFMSPRSHDTIMQKTSPDAGRAKLQPASLEQQAQEHRQAAAGSLGKQRK